MVNNLIFPQIPNTNDLPGCEHLDYFTKKCTRKILKRVCNCEFVHLFPLFGGDQTFFFGFRCLVAQPVGFQDLSLWHPVPAASVGPNNQLGPGSAELSRRVPSPVVGDRHWTLSNGSTTWGAGWVFVDFFGCKGWSLGLKLLSLKIHFNCFVKLFLFNLTRITGTRPVELLLCFQAFLLLDQWSGLMQPLEDRTTGRNIPRLCIHLFIKLPAARKTRRNTENNLYKVSCDNYTKLRNMKS